MDPLPVLKTIVTEAYEDIKDGNNDTSENKNDDDDSSTDPFFSISQLTRSLPSE